MMNKHCYGILVMLCLLTIALPCWATKIAILVGCNGYDHPNLPALRGSCLDVEKISTVLMHTGYEVHAMTDAALDENGKPKYDVYYPSKLNIERQLPIWAQEKSLGKGDTILFFFSGHGIRSKEGIDYLAPLQAKDLADESLVKVTWIYEQLRGTGAENIVIITDACRNVLGKSVHELENFGQNSVDEFNKIPNTDQRYAFLRSCAEGQRSYEMDDGKGSYFAYYLAEGLNGAADGAGEAAQKDGTITIGELVAYAKTKVSELARKKNNVQVPQFERKGEKPEAIVLGNGSTTIAVNGATEVIFGTYGAVVDCYDQRNLQRVKTSIILPNAVSALCVVKNYLYCGLANQMLVRIALDTWTLDTSWSAILTVSSTAGKTYHLTPCVMREAADSLLVGGTQAGSGVSGGIIRVNLTSGQCTNIYHPNSSSSVFGMCYNATDKLYYFTRRNNGTGTPRGLYSLNGKTEEVTLVADSTHGVTLDAPEAVAIAADGRLVVTDVTSRDNPLYLFDRSGAFQQSITQPGIDTRVCDFDQQGRLNMLDHNGILHRFTYPAMTEETLPVKIKMKTLTFATMNQ